MRHRPRILSEHDRAAWAAYAAPIRALPGRERPAPVPPPHPPEPAAVAPAPAHRRAERRRLGPLVVGEAPPGLDATSWRRLTSGRMPVERRLDLHGLTVQRGFERFTDVLTGAAATGLRCIEVITGRGSGEAGGVLRRELPLWLNRGELRPLILAAAHPHRRNDGSVLLLLRRG